MQQVPCVPCKRSRHDPSNEKVKSIGQSFQTRCSRIKGNNPNNYSCNDVTFRHDLSSDNIDNVKLNVPTSVSERRGMCVGDGNAEQVDHPYGLLVSFTLFLFYDVFRSHCVVHTLLYIVYLYCIYYMLPFQAIFSSYSLFFYFMCFTLYFYPIF